jgi:RND family efflux transporter MFP subunit
VKPDTHREESEPDIINPTDQGDGADKQAYHLDQSVWSRLNSTTSEEAYTAAWLELQCQMIDGVKQGVVVLGEPEEGPFAPVAYWPEGAEVSFELSVVAELAMSERKGLVRKEKSTEENAHNACYALAYPVMVDDQLCGVVAIEITHRNQQALHAVMRQLQWGCAGLEVLVRRKTLTPKDRLVMALELVAVCLEHERFQAAATGLVTELATRLSCEWVSVGFMRSRHAHVHAFSHSAEIDNKSNLMRVIGKAMDEALDQQAVLVYPPMLDSPPRASRAHEELSRYDNLGHICTIPLGDSGRPIGALALARPHGQLFSEEEVGLCKHIALLVGPVLDTKRKDDRWLAVKAWDSASTQLGKLFGPRYIGFKLGALATIALVAFLALAEGEYRVSADASLEGTVQRAITAPLAGYIEQAQLRAGDIVSKGDLLCTLDEKDLQLERAKWRNQKEQRQREYSEALADSDRARVRILGAQIDQAESQIALLQEQLKRMKIKAPFDGVVVSGDLTQMLGAPVERGEVLFEIAPLNSYRVILKVDERDYSQVSVGQQGQLALAGLPQQTLPMVIEKKTPVSVPEEGRNYFRIEARLEESFPLLRPGMEGVGKIYINDRKLIWIWTHEFQHWLRFWAWSWWP